MTKEISVVVDDDGITATIYDGKIIKIFKKINDKWEVNRELPIKIDVEQGLQGVRESISEIVDFLDDCKIFVGREVTGILYNILDAKAINICEMKGSPDDFLDYLIEENKKYESELLLMEKEKNNEYPIEKDKEGYYYINLKKLNESNPNISSKQVLKPFFTNDNFYELEVICGHVPKWFETELNKFNLKFESIKESENQYKVIIYHKTCE